MNSCTGGMLGGWGYAGCPYVILHCLPYLVEAEVAFFAIGFKFSLDIKATGDSQFGQLSAVEVMHVAQADLFHLTGEDVAPVEEGVAGIEVCVCQINLAPGEDALLPFGVDEESTGGEQAP